MIRVAYVCANVLLLLGIVFIVRWIRGGLFK